MNKLFDIKTNTINAELLEIATLIEMDTYQDFKDQNDWVELTKNIGNLLFKTPTEADTGPINIGEIQELQNSGLLQSLMNYNGSTDADEFVRDDDLLQKYIKERLFDCLVITDIHLLNSSSIEHFANITINGNFIVRVSSDVDENGDKFTIPSSSELHSVENEFMQNAASQILDCKTMLSYTSVVNDYEWLCEHSNGNC